MSRAILIVLDSINMEALRGDLFACLRFWSRLPVPSAEGNPPALSLALRMLPIAALIIALPATIALLIAANVLALPPFVSAGIAIATLVATTGALHEDGLADTADGLFGGASPQRRLDIMRDSRTGSFGALALGLSLILRIGALAALVDASLALGVAALLTAAAVSRTAGLMPLVLLPPARADGLGVAAAQPDSRALRIAVVLALLCLTLPIAAGVSLPRTIIAALGAVAAAYALIPLARAKIGGQTGDIAGASQQAAEIAFLAVLSGAVAA